MQVNNMTRAMLSQSDTENLGTNTKCEISGLVEIMKSFIIASVVQLTRNIKTWIYSVDTSRN